MTKLTRAEVNEIKVAFWNLTGVRNLCESYLAQEDELKEVSIKKDASVMLAEHLQAENQALKAQLDPRDTWGLYDGDNLP